MPRSCRRFRARRRQLGLRCLVSLLAVGLGSAAGADPDAGAAGAFGVAPGDSSRSIVAPDRCPSFSWALVPGASEYELLVLQVDRGDGNDLPSVRGARRGERVDDGVILRRQFPAGVNHWQPSAAECFVGGIGYAWSVRAAVGSGWIDWSEPLLFEIPGRFVERVPDRPLGLEPFPGPDPAPRAAITAPAISTGGLVESTSAGFRFPDGTVQRSAFSLVVLHAVVRADGTLVHGNVGSVTRSQAGIYVVDIGRLALACSVTATLGEYNPQGQIVVIPEGDVATLAYGSSSEVRVYTYGPAGGFADQPFTVQVVCDPSISLP